jgi:N6-adenosine-specific RNA methylase IME4
MFADPWARHQSVKKRAAPYQNRAATSARFFPMAVVATAGVDVWFEISLSRTFSQTKQNPNCFRNWGFGI